MTQSKVTASKKFLGVQSAVRRILVLEKHEHIPAIGQQLRDGRRNRLAFRRRIFRFSEPEIGEVGGGNFRDFELLGLRPAKSGVVLPEQVINRVDQPGGVPELEGVADIGRKASKEVREELQVASEVRRKLKEDWAEPVRGAERVDRAQKNLGEFGRVLEPQHVGNALVGFRGKEERRLGRLDPVLEGARRGEPPKRVVDLDAVQPTGIVLEKLFGGYIRGVKSGLPGGISKS